MKAVIRLAAPADLDAVAEIFTHYVRHTVITFEETPPPVAAWRQRLDNLAAQELPFLVAELSGEVVGYAYATPWRPKPAYRHMVENSIYLAPGRTGQGLAGSPADRLCPDSPTADDRRHRRLRHRCLGRTAPPFRLHRRGPAGRRRLQT